MSTKNYKISKLFLFYSYVQAAMVLLYWPKTFLTHSHSLEITLELMGRHLETWYPLFLRLPWLVPLCIHLQLKCSTNRKSVLTVNESREMKKFTRSTISFTVLQ